MRCLASCLLLSLALLAGCGGSAKPSTVATVPAPAVDVPAVAATPLSPASSHVVLVVEENRSYDQVIGNPAAPYLNGLAAQYALATNYFANAHFSIPNYFMLTTGQIETLNDNFAGTVTDNNLARVLDAAGKTWKVYAEDLPSAGYLGGDTAGYVKRHNPFAFFSDVINSPQEAANIVPFTQFAADLSAGTLPNFSMIVPNLTDDGHDASLATADAWLQPSLAPLFASPQFQQDGVLIVTFDESEVTDLQMGGGHIATILAGPKVNSAFQSITVYQHQSTLRLILDLLGVSDRPGSAADAPSMSEFFQ